MQCLCIIYILRFCMGILLLIFLFPLSMSPFSSFPSAPLLLPSFPSRSLNHKISTEQSQKNRMNCHEKRPSFVTVQGVFFRASPRGGDRKLRIFNDFRRFPTIFQDFRASPGGGGRKLTIFDDCRRFSTIFTDFRASPGGGGLKYTIFDDFLFEVFELPQGEGAEN